MVLISCMDKVLTLELRPMHSLRYVLLPALSNQAGSPRKMALDLLALLLVDVENLKWIHKSLTTYWTTSFGECLSSLESSFAQMIIL